MIPEAWLLLVAYTFAAFAAMLYASRRPSPRARALSWLLITMLAVEAARTALGPVDARWAALLDNGLLIAQLLAPVAAAEAVLLRGRPWLAGFAFGLLVAALGAWPRGLQLQLPHVELVAVVAALGLTALWVRGRPALRPPEFGALAIIAASLVGLLWLGGDIVTRQLWATNGKVWAWMMLLVGIRLLGALLGRSGAS